MESDKLFVNVKLPMYGFDEYDLGSMSGKKVTIKEMNDDRLSIIYCYDDDGQIYILQAVAE